MGFWMLYDACGWMINDLEDPFHPRPFYDCLGWEFFWWRKELWSRAYMLYLYKNIGGALYNWILPLADLPSL